MRRLFALATVLLLAAPAWADFADGQAAYERGDYETAFEEWLPLAEQGAAQFNLRNIYRTGTCVPQDLVQAHMWLNLATALMIEEKRRTGFWDE